MRVSGVTGNVSIVAARYREGVGGRKNTRRTMLERSGYRNFSLIVHDGKGNVMPDQNANAEFHPETGSLPLEYTGNRTHLMERLPKDTAYSLLSFGTTDAIGAWRFKQVIFDASAHRVYMVERGREVSVELPDKPIVTTTHRRFVQAQDEGWNRTSRLKDGVDGLWTVNTGIRIDVAPPEMLKDQFEIAKRFEEKEAAEQRRNRTEGCGGVDSDGGVDCKKSDDEDDLSVLPRTVTYGGARCIAAPTFVVSLPLPLFYWHTVAEGVFPLAHAIRKMQERIEEEQRADRELFDDEEDEEGELRSKPLLPLIVLAQGWTDRLVPRFLASMLKGLSPWPIIDMQTLREAGPTCFLDLTVGYYPQITFPSELRETIRWMLPLYGIEMPPSSNSGDDDAKNEHGERSFTTAAPPVVTFIQRRSRCAAADRAWVERMKNASIESNVTDEEIDRAARGITNVNELAEEARMLGAAVQIVALEQMSVPDQMSLFHHSDVIVAAHGSAWANTAFMRERSAAIQLYGYGVKHGCVCLMNMYRYTWEAMDDLCNGLISDFPSVTPGYYAEIMETDPTAHVAPFDFADEFCSDDPLRGDSIAIDDASVDRAEIVAEEQEEEGGEDKSARQDSRPSTETTLSCREEHRGDDDGCFACEREIESHALEDPRWLWGHHFHRAYRWFKGASFTIRPSAFRETLRTSLRTIGFDPSWERKERTERSTVASLSWVTSGFGGRGGGGRGGGGGGEGPDNDNDYDPPYLRGYFGPYRHVAVACCNLSPEWLLEVLEDIRSTEQRDRVTVDMIDEMLSRLRSERSKMGDFVDVSLAFAKDICDSSEMCKGVAYSALGALFKSAYGPLIPFHPKDMLVETGVANAPATFYEKMVETVAAAATAKDHSCASLRIPRRLSLAYVHHFLPHGGVETIIHTLTKTLARGCFDVTVFLITDWISPDGGPMRVPIEQAGATVEVWPLLTTHPPSGEPGHAGVSFPVDMSVLHDFLPRLMLYDVVHTFYGGAALSTVGMDAVGLTRLLGKIGGGRRRRVPVHVTSIAAVIPLVRGHAYADAVVMDSVPSFERVKRQETMCDVRVELIEAGIDTERFDPDNVAQEWNRGSRIDDGEKEIVVGFVGRIAHQKQPLLLIRVAAHLRHSAWTCRDEGATPAPSTPRIRFVVVGSGPLASEVTALSDELDAGVEFFDSTPHVPEVLASMDVFLHLSVWDTAAYAVREAMAMKLPVVALRSNVGVADYVQNGTHGILVENDGVDTVARALTKLACNATLRENMGKSGREEIVASSSTHEFARRHSELYSELWGRGADWAT